jgi:1-deoxy-D-xylulose-5-phosphate synthase
LVGADGATHAGNYDIAYLRCIPNMSIACPADENECRQLLSSAFEQNHPVAVRYPRGAGAGVAVQPSLAGLPFGKGEIRLHGENIAILAFGTLLYPAIAVADKLGLTAVNMRWAKPLDKELLLELASSHAAIVTVEDAAVMGGAGSAVQEALQVAGVVLPVLSLGLPDLFIEHGDPGKLMAMHGLDAAGIEAAISARFSGLLAQASKGKPLSKAA